MKLTLKADNRSRLKVLFSTNRKSKERNMQEHKIRKAKKPVAT